VLNWGLGKVALGPLNLINTNWAVFIAFCYIWLPYMVIPVYAALDRIPPSMIEASQDLGGRSWRTTRSVIVPLALPGIVAGSIFTFSLTLGDYIIPQVLDSPMSSSARSPIQLPVQQHPARGGDGDGADRDHGDLPARRQGPRRVQGAVMESTGLKVGLRVWVALVLLFLFLPILLIVLSAFDPATVESWPIRGFTTHWFSLPGTTRPCASAFLLSVRVGLLATGSRYCPARRRLRLVKFASSAGDAISFLLVLPDRAARHRHGSRAELVLRVHDRPAVLWTAS
jgi:ABC-type spermidine/putrescine transport system permease subunit I